MFLCLFGCALDRHLAHHNYVSVWLTWPWPQVHHVPLQWEILKNKGEDTSSSTLYVKMSISCDCTIIWVVIITRRRGWCQSTLSKVEPHTNVEWLLTHTVGTLKAVSDKGPVWVQSSELIPCGFESLCKIISTLSKVEPPTNYEWWLTHSVGISNILNPRCVLMW